MEDAAKKLAPVIDRFGVFVGEHCPGLALKIQLAKSMPLDLLLSLFTAEMAGNGGSAEAAADAMIKEYANGKCAPEARDKLVRYLKMFNEVASSLEK